MKWRYVQIAIVSILFKLMDANSAMALNETTHAIINEQAARQSRPNKPGLNQILKNELGFPQGIEEPLRGREVFEWLREGGIREDSPICRTTRHFHDPLQPWESAGLRTFNPIIVVPCGGSSFPSSVHWAQEPNQGVGKKGSWQDARQHYLRALTASNPGTREEAFADTFQAIGQLMHLVVDASVIEHVRNDPHLLESALRALGQRGYGSYEHWVSDQHGPRGSSKEQNFITTYLSSPINFDASILQQPTNDSKAPVPIARLIDTDAYTGLASGPNVTKNNPAIGIAEFANANFFSEDTQPGQYPFPDINSVVPSGHPAPKTGRARAYYKKGPNDGVQVDPVLAECVLDQAAIEEGILDPFLYTCTDENVWAQTAREMLPRAVSYAGGVLDYFFRGTLDFTVSAGATPPDQTLTITNTSSEAMDGTFTLYADNFSGGRSSVQGASFNLSLGSGDTSGPITFTPPSQIQAYVLVFEGRLGNEDGAVAGKVKSVSVNAFVVWHVRFNNDQFDLIHLGSQSTGACFIRFVQSLSSSGTHTGPRRDYVFFAFVNDPSLSVPPLNTSDLQLTAQVSVSAFSLVPKLGYSPTGGSAVGIIQGTGGRSCGGGQPFPFAPTVTALVPASQADPRFFGQNPIPPPNHYVYLADSDGLFRDTGVVASNDLVVTKRLTSVSFAQIQQIAQGLHPLLVPPASFPKAGAFYAFAEFDIPNVDGWRVEVTTNSNNVVWGGTTHIVSISAAEMWDMANLILHVSTGPDINIYLPHQRIKTRVPNFVFGQQYHRTEQRSLSSFTLRYNPNDPFNRIRESNP